MRNFLKYCVSFSFALLCSTCTRTVVTTNHNAFGELKRDTAIRYAKRFSISENEKLRVVYLFGNRNINDTTCTYIFLKDSSANISLPRNSFVFRSSCKKIASLSSIYTTMLSELGELDHVVAIENIDYYTNPAVIRKFEKGELSELSKGPKLDIEKTIALHPDVIFNFGMGYPERDANSKVSKANIPLVISVDHLEETPLARAEWIKFFAAFTGKQHQADSIFKSAEKNYYALKEVAATSKQQPTVFSEIKFGEIWYVPGGKSFASTLFRDANASYIWKENNETGSLHLSFEQVYNKAKDADFWLNMALVRSKQELQAQEARYAEFKAFKTGQLYNNIKNMNSKGFSDYWETGILHPDRVLHDLVFIFHPELKSRLENDLYYYKKLE